MIGHMLIHLHQINQISSVYPNLALPNGSDTDNQMEALLRKWEALKIVRESAEVPLS
jgi:hypothetical protein